MKLYDSKTAPNPRRTRIFLAEKGIEVPTEQVDIMAQAAQDARNTPRSTRCSACRRWCSTTAP